MDLEDRDELRTLWGGTTAIGVAMVVAGAFLALSTIWGARALDSTVGEVLGTREVDTSTGPRPELLVGYQTAGGETMMFAEETGPFAPEIGDRVTVWYSDGPPPQALIVRQKFVWPTLLLPVGLLLSAFGIWRLRRTGHGMATDIDLELEDI